jgi:hypothetical protein
VEFERAAPCDSCGGVSGFTALDHICLVVPDLPLATAAIQALGGWPVLAGQTTFDARGVQLRFPVLKIELLTPTAPTPFSRFLKRCDGAAGIQHMTWLVRDVPAAAEGLAAYGIDAVNTNTSSEGWHETLVPARYTGNAFSWHGPRIITSRLSPTTNCARASRARCHGRQPDASGMTDANHFLPTSRMVISSSGGRRARNGIYRGGQAGPAVAPAQP